MCWLDRLVWCPSGLHQSSLLACFLDRVVDAVWMSASGDLSPKPLKIHSILSSSLLPSPSPFPLDFHVSDLAWAAYSRLTRSAKTSCDKITLS
ncbi:hypothetical protein CPB85DRAFT_1282142 [Mucidula mucida]|nr:hypothetical protein CPB85DRAFT_1282142 [Mucidula mucida]